jgi:hypothetical protein
MDQKLNEIDYGVPVIMKPMMDKRAKVKVLYGGRESGKSWMWGLYVVIKSLNEKCTIWCTKEIEGTIVDSSLKVIRQTIERLKLTHLFDINKYGITCNSTGSDFLFYGLREQDDTKAKSREQVKYVWISEADYLTEETWDVLYPTIKRNEGFEILIDFNPQYEEDFAFAKLKTGLAVDDTIAIHVNWYDNPFVNDESKEDIVKMHREDKKKYSYIYGGIPKGRGGIIYTMYDKDWHVEPIDLFGEDFRTANHFMTIDPHPQHYPAIAWWALTKWNILHCYNEFPYVGPEFKNKYYEELREDDLPKDWNLKKLCDIIKTMDGTEYGVTKVRRVIDPRYISTADKGNSLSPTKGIIQLFAQQEVTGFEIPPHMFIDPMRESLKNLLKTYNPQSIKSIYNTPQIQIAPWCKNMNRAFERHRMDEDDKYEDEKYKDMIDIVRYMLAVMAGKIIWVDNRKNEKAVEEYVDPYTMNSFTQSNTAMR